MALADILDYGKQFDKMAKAAIEAANQMFPIEGSKRRIDVKRVWVEKNKDIDAVSDQKTVKLKGGSWDAPVYAHLILYDKATGKQVDEIKRKKIFKIPMVTPRMSYIIDGNEYQTVNQLRLKPGVYNLRKSNDQIESQFNLAKGANFKLKLNEGTGVITISFGTSNIHLLPVLKDLGLSDTVIRTKLGDDVADINMKAARNVYATESIAFASKLSREPINTRAEAVDFLKEYFSGTDMGKGHSVTTLDIIDSAKKLLAIAKGKEKPDDRDSLEAKELHSIDDFIAERIEKSKKQIEREIKRNIDKRESLKEIVGVDTFNKPIKTLFTSTSLAATTEQTNPMDMISRAFDVTLMGEGGIMDANVVTPGARDLHESQLGFADPIMTPESNKIGVNLQMAMNSAKVGNDYLTAVYDITGKSPKMKQVTAADFGRHKVAFADEYKKGPGGKFIPKSRNIRIYHKGTMKRVSPSAVEYIMASAKGTLGLVSNLVPFMGSDNGSRLFMAGKHLTQSVALKHREAPLVQTVIGEDAGTFHDSIGKAISVLSKVNGDVVSVSADKIVIKGLDGKKYEHQIYNNFPLNQRSFINDDPLVKKGDKVKKGQVLAENSYVKNGTLALGTNMDVAYIPIKGYSFEDSIVISESAARKLASEHMYKEVVIVGENTVTSKSKYNAFFPGEMTIKASSKLDEDGVIKKGQVVEDGDMIAAVLTRNDTDTPSRLKKLSRSLVKTYRDSSITWHYGFKGVVTDVVKGAKEIVVYIKTEEPAVIGDKLSGTHGNKGTIGLIMPDIEMPVTESGGKIDIALNPHTVPSRMNPGQLIETIAAKIAAKIRKTYLIENFSVEDNATKVKEDALKAGVASNETLIDPQTGAKIPDVFVGKQYVLKLNHLTRKKFQARTHGAGYTKEESPGRGGEGGGQSMDPLAVHAMLVHGATNLLHETHAIKSNRNDEYWRAVQMGQSLPTPKGTFAFDKFVGLLKGSGINVKKDGSTIQLQPLTDKDILAQSNGEIKNIGIVRGKNLKEEAGGLFDQRITGGLDGTKWSHIKLHEPIPNPVFENAIKAIIKLANGEAIKKNQYDGIVNGEVFVDKQFNIVEDPDDGETGGKVIQKMLGKIDLGKRIKELETNLMPNSKKTKLDKYRKEYRYLKGLERLGKKPTDYVIKNVPVVPPIFRPIYSLPDGNTTVSSLVHLYKDVKAVNDQLKDSLLPEDEKANLRGDMNKSVNALFGLGESITNPNLKGTIAEIKGDQPKTGLFQSKLIKRRQDLTGRTVITPDPTMSVDNIGLPDKMAWNIYRPFVVKRMVQMGYKPLAAREAIDNETDVAQKMLEAEMDARPVVLNRAPTLHKFGIMGFKPVRVGGKAIKLPSLATGGFNADFDGDTMVVHVPVTKGGIEEAFKMMPTNHLRNPGNRSLMLVPSMESVTGLNLITKMGKTKNKKYGTLAEARAAMKHGDIRIDDTVTIANKKTSVGRFMVNAILPVGMRNYSEVINKGKLKAILETVYEKHKSDFGKIADGLKEIGNIHSYYGGATVSLNDLTPMKKDRDAIIRKAILAVEALEKKKLPEDKFRGKATAIFSKATDDIDTALMKHLKGKDNEFINMMNAGAKGNMVQVRSILAAPMIKSRISGKSVLTPVGKSYAEGLSSSELWIDSFGSRKGIFDRVSETSDPGDVAKMLAGAGMNYIVTKDDCGTSKGISQDVSDPEIVDRFSAESIVGVVKRNEAVTPLVISKLKRKRVKGLKVRSSLTCEAAQGVCTMCAGRTEEGGNHKVGESLGLLSAQAISEPSVQLIMRTFHTGGAASGGSKVVGSFDRLKQLIKMPDTLPGKATLAAVSGRVDSISKSPIGGSDIVIAGRKHHVKHGLEISVKKGQNIKRGDALSAGPVKLQELLEYKGMPNVRKYMTNEIHDLYKDSTGLRRSVIEHIVKAITALTKIDDPGKTGYIPGDIASFNKVVAANRDMDKKDRARHSPIIKGIMTMPSAITSHKDADWMGMLGFKYLKKTIREGASQGWSSDIHGYHPVPGLAYASEFGKGEDGRY